ncbi:metallophosphoesterase family protein [Propionibacteriaceae bacterium G57]|uniref:metallophosphoesterase family protein n=1 Tax=Aestuariimicrobium sp. G57 TaxID=3418485 RepID=UPI003DA6D2FB
MTALSRRHFNAVAMTFAAASLAPLSAYAVPRDQQTTSSAIDLLTDPFLQLPGMDSVRVAWFTEISGGRHLVLVGDSVESLTLAQVVAGTFGAARVFNANDVTMTQTAEDFQSQLPADRKPTPEQGIVARPIHRHEAAVTGLSTAGRTKYRVASIKGTEAALSAVYTLAPAVPAGAGAKLMLTSDHQAMQNTATNLELAAKTMGQLDAVLVAGDLVNIPDRASEWFDDTRGSAFFPCLQGSAGRADRGGHIGRGAAIVQNTPMFPAIGNHEVQGRRSGPAITGLNASFGMPVPTDIAAGVYDTVAGTVNPSGNAATKARWIENHSFSTRTYEEVFTLPTNDQGHSRWYATTIGNVRVITLYQTRIWRGTDANADSATRTASSRYQESAVALADPLLQGYGEFIFESIAPGTPQFDWLAAELKSPERKACEYTIIQLHEAPHGLGDNITPPFSDPERIEEKDPAGNVVGVRYEYHVDRNPFFTQAIPMIEAAGVQLVLNGHSHLWNRFVARNGITHYMEGSNTGNTYGAFTTRNQRARHVPPAPWLSQNYPKFDDPYGLQPQVPNIEPYRFGEGDPMPYVSDNFVMAFQLFDSHTGELSTWSAPVGATLQQPVLIDRIKLQPSTVVPLPEPTPSTPPPSTGSPSTPPAGGGSPSTTGTPSTSNPSSAPGSTQPVPRPLPNTGN